MPRRIDHLVIAVHDLDGAAAFYQRLGFQVGARNRHPWGTENRIVQFSASFLELITLGENARRRTPRRDVLQLRRIRSRLPQAPRGSGHAGAGQRACGRRTRRLFAREGIGSLRAVLLRANRAQAGRQRNPGGVFDGLRARIRMRRLRASSSASSTFLRISGTRRFRSIPMARRMWRWWLCRHLSRMPKRRF